MIAALLFAAALSGPADGGQVAVIARTPAPGEAAQEGAETRRVCRYERATGSNLQQRVCRDVPRQGVQDQQTREFLRATQRSRPPADGGAGGDIPIG
jgi:hypothetical protein